MDFRLIRSADQCSVEITEYKFPIVVGLVVSCLVLPMVLTVKIPP